MFQNNPLLAQLKQQLNSQTPRIEGVIKATEKGFGFLEVDTQTRYFIPPNHMKKVMSGDRVIAILTKDRDKAREIAEPESLVEPFLTRFVARIHIPANDKRLFVIPEHPLLKNTILARPIKGITTHIQAGDWVVAELRRHPLKKEDKSFFAEITQFITHSADLFAPWWVTLAKYQLENSAPSEPNEPYAVISDIAENNRVDLSELNFITLDNRSTEDMDDAVYVAEKDQGILTIYIAIADPSAYITVNGSLDNEARKRAFTHYLPGLNIPMLPRTLAEEECSLRPLQRRRALVCYVDINQQGEFCSEAQFVNAWIESKARLYYDDVSDWLENEGEWQPQNEQIAKQLKLLATLTQQRIAYRSQHTVLFKDQLDHHFKLDECGNVIDIIAEQRRIAHRIVEEAMITANICAAALLRERLGYGIFNVHTGFSAAHIEHIEKILSTHSNENFSANAILTLEGFLKLRRYIDEQPSCSLNNQLRRYQSPAQISVIPGSHFGLGLDVYATWTSPIRKYGDLINQRLLKAIITQQSIEKPDDDITQHIMERRRLNRVTEREISEWLYARYMQSRLDEKLIRAAEILEINRGGMRVKLLDIGAIVFIPHALLHTDLKELTYHQDNGTISIQGELRFTQGERINVRVTEVRLDTRTLIAIPA